MRFAFDHLSPAGAAGRLQIFIFHRVLAAPDPLAPGEPDRATFDRLCGWIRAWFQVLPLDEAVRRLRDASLPARAAAITFDDGYADNHDVALPVLARYGLNATFFVATGFLDGGRMWNDTVIEAVRGTRRATIEDPDAGLVRPVPLSTAEDRRRAIRTVIGHVKYMEPRRRIEVVEAFARRCGAPLPGDLMMSSDQVRALRRAGMVVGAHTVNHPILARLDDAEAEREIDSGRRALESMLNERVGLFAYPNGKPGEDYGETAVAIVRRLGFDAAVSTRWAAAGRGADPHQLPRFTPWDRTRWRFALRLMRNYGHA